MYAGLVCHRQLTLCFIQLHTLTRRWYCSYNKHCIPLIANAVALVKNTTKRVELMNTVDHIVLKICKGREERMLRRIERHSIELTWTLKKYLGKLQKRNCLSHFNRPKPTTKVLRDKHINSMRSIESPCCDKGARTGRIRCYDNIKAATRK